MNAEKLFLEAQEAMEEERDLCIGFQGELITMKQILQNIEKSIPNYKRDNTPNWVMVHDYILRDTSVSGSTSCINFCKVIGVNPYRNRIVDYKK